MRLNTATSRASHESPGDLPAMPIDAAGVDSTDTSTDTSHDTSGDTSHDTSDDTSSDTSGRDDTALPDDADGDGWGNDGATTIAYAAPSTGYVAMGGAGDNANRDYHPEAFEADCTDPEDYDCDGSIDETSASGETAGYLDGDGHGTGSAPVRPQRSLATNPLGMPRTPQTATMCWPR